MKIKITNVWHRPSTDVKFWTAPEELKILNEPLMASGDMTMSWSLSDDELFLTQVSTFANEGVFDTVTTDPIRTAFRNDRNKYNTDNNITSVSIDRAEYP